jgi:hypothetical protein
MVSVNKTPARAITLVEEVIKKLQPDYHIIHVANSQSECASFVAVMYADFISFLVGIDELEMIMASLIVQPNLIVSTPPRTAHLISKNTQN